MHAMCVHDGGADGGHYFALIKDHKLNKWRKFNDTKIDFIDEEDVFAQANGGHGAMTAYWVFYISQAQVDQAKQIAFYNKTDNNLYSGLISEQMKAEISQANDDLQRELSESKVKETCEEMYSKY